MNTDTRDMILQEAIENIDGAKDCINIIATPDRPAYRDLLEIIGELEQTKKKLRDAGGMA